MNVEFLPSELIAAVRYNLQRFIENEETPTFADLRDLRQKLKTIQELAKENEDDNLILEHRLRMLSNPSSGRVFPPAVVEITPDANVVNLPIRRKLRFSVVRPDGGDAA